MADESGLVSESPTAPVAQVQVSTTPSVLEARLAALEAHSAKIAADAKDAIDLANSISSDFGVHLPMLAKLSSLMPHLAKMPSIVETFLSAFGISL